MSTCWCLSSFFHLAQKIYSKTQLVKSMDCLILFKFSYRNLSNFQYVLLALYISHYIVQNLETLYRVIIFVCSVCVSHSVLLGLSLYGVVLSQSRKTTTLGGRKKVHVNVVCLMCISNVYLSKNS